MEAPFQPGAMSSEEIAKAKEILKVLYTENHFGYVYQDPTARLSQEQQLWLKNKLGLKLTHAFGETTPEGKPIESPVARMCVNCQARHLLRYNDARDPKGRKTLPWSVECGFVRQNAPQSVVEVAEKTATQKDGNVDEIIKYLMAAIDPVSWAETMLGFSDSSIGKNNGEEAYIRSYQKEQLRCTSKRYAIRQGRRTGKTFAVCIRLLNILFTKEFQKGYDAEGNPVIRGPKIMIITPYQAQLSLIFDELETLISRNRSLASSVATGTNGSLYVRTPHFTLGLKDTVIKRTRRDDSSKSYEVTKSGGSIEGFISGVGTKKDGSGGGTMRGQSADYIYLDEVDMIPDGIVEAVIGPIIITYPHVQIIASSTPIGSRGKFYTWSLEDSAWKADYYPGTVLPHWDRIEAQVLNETTAEAFEAEYMAHFIQGTFGVFRPDYIEAAWADYEYVDTHPETSDAVSARKFWMEAADIYDPSQLQIVMGIDWNQNAGTEYVVIAYSAKMHWWWVVEAYNMPQSQWTSKGFKEKLAELNHKWKPDYIYADKGWGHTIIEDMQLFGEQLKGKPNRTPFEDSCMRLSEVLKAFAFKENVELMDPVDGSTIVKEGKTFLVENAIRVFETQRISYPFTDNTLTKQLQNYIILKHHATTGKPVYGMAKDKIGDHRLDALMLALGGLFLEAGKFSRNQIRYGEASLISKADFMARGKPQDLGPTLSKDKALDMIRRAMSLGENVGLLGNNKLTVEGYNYSDNPEIDALTRRIKAADAEMANRHTSYGTRSSRGQEFKPDAGSVLDYYRARAQPDQSGKEHDTWAMKQLDYIKTREALPSGVSRSKAFAGGGKRKMF